MPKLVSGEWTGTMCLTEPQCGTDLGQVKTKAEPQADGSYKITGTKIFISAGEHDLAENIIHIVLARLPDAPKGTRGISLFIVPKFLVNADGSLGERNGVKAARIEHKMGIRASATCVMNFDGATGYMIAEPNKGLEAMFTFMNTARVGTAVQGVCACRAVLPGLAALRQGAPLHARLVGQEGRRPGCRRADLARRCAPHAADPEGLGRRWPRHDLPRRQYGRHMVQRHHGKRPEAKYEDYDDKLGFFTPILKGFLTEMGLESANLGMQVFGGHGYIKEHGMEQIARDARIATLYEGTTGIQALDLLGRKVLLTTRGKCVRQLYQRDDRPGQTAPAVRWPRWQAWPATCFKRAVQWKALTTAHHAARQPKTATLVSAACYDYLMYSGYMMMGHFWLKQALVAEDKLARGGKDSKEFYTAKLQTAEFYFERLLHGHKRTMLAPTSSVMQMDQENFTFL
jgi:alkylation response protein AidB-like acyl-CoA dehydrogenase